MEIIKTGISSILEFIGQVGIGKILTCGVLIAGIVVGLVMFAMASSETSDIRDYTSGGLIPLFEAMIMIVLCAALLAVVVAS